MYRAASSETFERLFQTAVSLVRKAGYEGVTVSQITQEAGVSKGNFFNYFPTKAHVLSESLRRSVDSAFEAVRLQGVAGAEAILVFSRVLAEVLATDRVVTEALVFHLSGLPTSPGGAQVMVREEERIRSWLEARLDEALPVSVPLVPADPGTLAFLLTWTILGTSDEWVRSEADREALQGMISGRVEFLLDSVGLPTDTDGGGPS